MKNWIVLASRKDTILRSLKVSLIVGTILAVINHADSLWTGQANGLTVMKIVLTYAVPYLVSTYAAVSALLRSKV